jgi:hypothetical protein
VDRLVAGATRYPPNRRLLDHLARERDHLFTFLRVPGVQATNWRAEHAIRPAVVCHKAWGGNRTVSRMPSPVAFPCRPSTTNPAAASDHIGRIRAVMRSSTAVQRRPTRACLQSRVGLLEAW